MNQVSALLLGELEDHVESIDVPAIHPYRMSPLGFKILESHELIRVGGRPSHFRGPLKPQQKQIKNHAIVLEYEAGELQASDQPIRIGVRHILICDGHIVFGCHVVGEVVIYDESEQSVEESQVHLLVDLLELGLHEDDAFIVFYFPDV